MRAAGDGGALPRAVARRAGGVRRHALVPRAHQAQLQAVWVLTPCLGTPPHRSAARPARAGAGGAPRTRERGTCAAHGREADGVPVRQRAPHILKATVTGLPARPWLGGCGRGVLRSTSLWGLEVT